MFSKQNYEKKNALSKFVLECHYVALSEVSFVRESPLSVSSMVVHTDQGLRETTILNVKCEGGVGDWGWGGWGALIVSTTLFCYSYHSFPRGSGSFKVPSA